MALTSVAAVRSFIGPAADADSEFLAQLVPAVCSAFANLVERKLELAQYTEFYSGRNTAVINLREYPVVAPLTGVWLDPSGFWGTTAGAFDPALTLLAEGVDYALARDGRGGAAEAGRLVRINGVWPGRFESRAGLLAARLVAGAGNVKVSYSAGYDVVPPEVQLALWQACARIRRERRYGWPIASMGYEEYHIAFMQRATELLLGSAAQVIARYKRITPRFERLS